jgi:Zn finger protein HypA/HybF involved in hydrogenase expression
MTQAATEALAHAINEWCIEVFSFTLRVRRESVAETGKLRLPLSLGPLSEAENGCTLCAAMSIKWFSYVCPHCGARRLRVARSRIQQTLSITWMYFRASPHRFGNAVRLKCGEQRRIVQPLQGAALCASVQAFTRTHENDVPLS